jgi:uncharacterized OB-fold protein
MSATTMQIPLVDYLVLDTDPHLRAHECSGCKALYFDRRNACARCGKRDFGRRVLASVGTVRAFTIVYRAAPKIPTPYISVVVDLDGGGIVKANLVDVEIDAASVPPGLRVELTTYAVGRDDDGTEAIAFGFRPLKGDTDD